MDARFPQKSIAVRLLRPTNRHYDAVMTDDSLEAAKNRTHDLLARAEADLAAGRISEAEWYTRLDNVVTPAYLGSTSPRAQSGHSGDEIRWRHARSLLVDGLDQCWGFAPGATLRTMSPRPLSPS